MTGRFLLILALAASCATPALAQPRGGILRVSLTNGTRGGEGQAEKVTLYRLRNEMTPVKELSGVSGSFEISDIEVEGERPMLLQVTSQGVNYNEPVQFGRGYEADAAIQVFDVFSAWNDSDLEVTTARALYRRDGAKFLVDEVYVVENRTKPPRTYHDPEGTFRFHLPTTSLLELRSVSARGESGMPVPQPAAPAGDGAATGTYVTKTAFKPGETELVVSYEVGYQDGSYEAKSQAFYSIKEIYAFVAPPDVRLDGDGWEVLGPEPEGRFAAFRKSNVVPGTPVGLRLSGGSERSESTESPAPAPAPSGNVSIIPDSSRDSKAVLVVLMAAALGYGLLSTLYPTSTRRG